MSALTLAGAALAVVSSAAAAPFEPPSVTRAGRSLMEIKFDELDFPTGDAKHLAQASDSAVVDGEQYDTGYVVLLRSGDEVGGGRFGQLVDQDGNGLMLDGAPYVSNGNDFTSLLPKGDKIYTVTHFESPEPMASYFTKSTQDPATGKLTVDSTEAMDWSSYGGLWNPCAGSVTPWQTHFGSEEYEPDARAWFDGWAANKTGVEWKDVVGEYWALYFGLDPASATNDDMYQVMFPYHYGYPWEVAVSDEGEIAKQVKMMAAGRLAIELPYVMPDNATVYVTDDGDNTMLGLYKLSEAGKLECGSVWGAKFIQVNGEGGGAFDVEWIQVGEEACEAEFRAMAPKLTFYDMFDASEINKEGTCKDGYTSINTQPGGQECLKVIEGMEKWASRFEYRRMAAYLGVTTEFAKWEGITLDTKRNRIFTAISEVREGMEDFKAKGEASDEFDLGGPNDVHLKWNPCGCVYSMDLDENYMATNFVAFICGDTDANTDANNTCNKENISSPDNIVYVPGHDGLVIGEDTDFHQNDVLWYYDWADGSLTRFLSTPYGSETTSPYFYPNINGWAYIVAVVQHPYGESDEDQADSPKATGTDSYAGYIGPFKAHPGSVDMALGVPIGGKLWNDFPAHGDDMASSPAAPPAAPGQEPMCMCPCSSADATGAYGAYGV